MKTAQTSERRRCAGFIAAAMLWLAFADPLAAQVVPPLSEETDTDRLINLNFRDSPLDQVLTFYSDLTGRTMIKSPGISATITLRGQTRMTEREALQAIESALAMHNVALVPMGERFLRVVQPTAVRQEGLPILSELPDEPFPEDDQILSVIVPLHHMELDEVQPIIQQLIHGYGKIQTLERKNSLMITDTASNLNRIMEVLDFVDRPVEIREDIFVRRIRHAEAGQVASRLNEFLQDRDERERRPQVAPRADEDERRAPPGVIRPGRRQPQEQRVAESPVEAAAELAERGIIQGKVKIVSDERINTLFIIARPVNFTFFDRIIDILDQPVDPEIIVRVINLEYALAEDIAGILNEFIGAAAAERPGGALREGEEGEDTPVDRAAALRDFAAGLAREQLQQAEGDEASRIGRLSPQTQILSDQRSNSLLLMGRRGDIAALEEIVGELDIMLGQVLIEAVIIEISLGKNVESGVDWLQRTLTAYSEERAGPAGGVVLREPVAAFGGGSAPGGLVDDLGQVRQALEGGAPPVGAGGLSYFVTFFDLNLDMVIRLAASSRDARILSTPVILTSDNTEARIVVGESRPVVTSTSTSTIGDRQVSQFQFRDIGINLTVTPRINPQRFVVMDILQSADNVGGFETIDGNRVPIITRREMEAQISVKSRSTIVLGGLVSTDRIMSTTKVPLLGDIPLLGRLFRSDTVEDSRTELLVLITPYVMMTPEEARMESARLHQHSHSSRTEWHAGWSDSEFAYPESETPRRREQPRSIPPEDALPPMQDGEYDRDAMQDVLRALHGEAPVPTEPPSPDPEPEPHVHDEPGGVIRWQEIDEEVFPAFDPEAFPDAEIPGPDAFEMIPEEGAPRQPVPEPDPVEFEAEPVAPPEDPAERDIFAPVPFR